ncbi:hypothetical protein GCM10027164_14370 [Algoriphagus taiwanensis]
MDLGTPETADNCSVASVSNDAPTVFLLGETLVTWMVEDASGNIETATQLVTVIDTEKPTITAPGAITVSTDAGLCEASGVDLGTPETGDNCSVASVSNEASTVFPIGETMVTWTVIDASGNIETATQLVTVIDTEKPTITAPQDLIINLAFGESVANSVDLGSPSAGDNCSGFSISNDAPESFPIGQTLVTWTAEDAAGNVSTDTQLVTVNQAAGPSCQLELKSVNILTLRLNASGVAVLNTSMVDQGSNSTCGPVSLSLSKTDFNCSDIGIQQVNFKVTDNEGNEANQLIEVTIIDDIVPRVRPLLSSFVWIIFRGQSFELPDFRQIVLASDNCGVELTQFPAPGTSLTSGGRYTIRIVGTDPSGNSVESSINLRLIVLNFRNPFAFREDSNTSMIEVPWNTSFQTVLSDYVSIEGKNLDMTKTELNWSEGEYNPIQPGVYFVEAKYKNEALADPVVQIPILVLDKPKPQDILLSNQVLTKNHLHGQVVGVLNTIDVADSIHEYSIESSSGDFKLEGNQLIWIGNGLPRRDYKIIITSSDRVGQSISKEFSITKEQENDQVSIYPNPAYEQTKIKVDLALENQVSIRIYDATGRLVMEESEFHERSFVKEVDLRLLSPGLYQVQVQIGWEIITKRLIKNQ